VINTSATDVEDEKRVFSGHDFRGTVTGNPGNLLMPPLIASFCPGNSASSPLEDKDVLDLGTLLESGINDGLGSDGFSATTTFIRSNDNTRLAIEDAITKRFGRETSKYDRVNGTDTSAGEESGNGLPGHRKVNRHGIAFLDSK
jgi:hypothetical protein